MFSQTVLHGISNNELRHRNREKRQEKKSEYGKKNSEQENRLPDGLLLEAVDELPDEPVHPLPIGEKRYTI